MSDSLFIPGPYFLLRAPLWSVEKWKEIIENKDWEEGIFQLYDQNQEFREAIAVASSSLRKELAKGPTKRTKAMAQSLFKYALRMSSRSTPFGLFSFVAVGEKGEKTQVALDLKNIRKKARPNMGWLHALIQKIYEDKKQFSGLSIYKNPLISRKMGRYCLNYYRESDKTKDQESNVVSIEATLITNSIFEIAETDITVNELCTELEKRIDPFNLGRMLEVIEELFKQQFLLSSLLPSLLSSSPLMDLISELPQKMDLDPLILAIETYNKTAIGKGESSLLQIYDVMQSLTDVNAQIQIDSYYEETDITLSKLVYEEAVQAASLLWKLTPKNHHKEKLQAYHSKFLEKYGIDRIVPLMEIINEETTLFDSVQKVSSSQSPFQTHLENWLRSQWYDQIGKKSAEILLTDAIIDTLYASSDKAYPDRIEALPSTDLFCRIIADSQKEIDDGNFLLMATYSSWQGGSAIGRFSYLFSEKINERIQSFYQEEEYLDEGAFFVETSSWPKNGNHANVSSSPCMRRYQIDLSSRKKGEGILTLDDIYVGADFEGLYLTLKQGGKRIYGCSGNLLRNELMPKPIQFIRNISLANNWRIEPELWGSLGKEAEYLPRIRYKKTILFPATWKAHGNLFSHLSHEKIIKSFTKWAEKRGLPRQCLLVYGDMSLLIDWQHPAQIKELVKKLARKETITFIEYIPSNWCKTIQGHHLSEVVFPLLKNPKYRKETKSFAPAFQAISTKDRLKLLGSEWLSYKFYIDEGEVDYFLTRYLQELGKELAKIEGVVGWFFVRYYDPEFHIRFRVRTTSKDTISEIIDRLREFTEKWLENRYIYNISNVLYEREIERYGGLECIEIAEALFCADSQACCRQIEMQRSSNEQESKVINNVLSILAFLDGFSLEKSEVLDILHTGKKHKEALAGFRTHRENLIKDLAQRHGNSNSFFQILNESTQYRRPLQQLMKKEIKEKNISSQIQIYASLLHMHCNRLGLNRIQERQTCAYAREAFKWMRDIYTSI